MSDFYSFQQLCDVIHRMQSDSKLWSVTDSNWPGHVTFAG